MAEERLKYEERSSTRRPVSHTSTSTRGGGVLVLMLFVLFSTLINFAHSTPVHKNSVSHIRKDLLSGLTDIETELDHVLSQLKSYAKLHTHVKHLHEPEPESSETDDSKRDFSYPELEDRSWSYPEFGIESRDHDHDHDY